MLIQALRQKKHRATVAAAAAAKGDYYVLCFKNVYYLHYYNDSKE